MTDYTKLVEALRGMDTGDSCPCEYYMMCEDSDCVFVQAADAIEALQAQLPKRGKWVRVEDKLPDDGDWAIFTNGKVVTVERFKEDAYNHFFPASQWFDFEDAIAWMPLPEPPKEYA